MTDYRVALDVYQGPMDLLLFLIKREEIDIYDIPISHITEQYLQYVDVLRELDPEVIGDFLVLAATLMEIKSRSLLPRPPVVEDDEELADPRLELVRQLLEYKRFKDAAYSLGEAAEERAHQHARIPALPPEPEESTDLENLEVWDLFEAFNRLLEQTGKRSGYHKVGVDDTPITLHADDVLDSLQRAGGEQQFEEIFIGRNRGEMIGLFLALLELIRQHRVNVRQDSPTTTILVTLLDPTPLSYNSFDTEDENVTAEKLASDASELETETGETKCDDGDVADTDDSSAVQADETAGDLLDVTVVDSAEAPIDEVLSDTGQAMKSSADPLPSLADMPADRARLAAPAHGLKPAQSLTPRHAEEGAESDETVDHHYDGILVADTVGDEQVHTLEELRNITEPKSSGDIASGEVSPETPDTPREHPHDTK